MKRDCINFNTSLLTYLETYTAEE